MVKPSAVLSTVCSNMRESWTLESVTATAVTMLDLTPVTMWAFSHFRLLRSLPHLASYHLSNRLVLKPDASMANFVSTAVSGRALRSIRLLIIGDRVRGLTNPEIGYRLNLAEGTVKNYITTILQKLDVRDRTQAAWRAREMGLLEGPAS